MAIIYLLKANVGAFQLASMNEGFPSGARILSGATKIYFQPWYLPLTNAHSITLQLVKNTNSGGINTPSCHVDEGDIS